MAVSGNGQDSAARTSTEDIQRITDSVCSRLTDILRPNVRKGPTLEDFAPRWLREYALANGHKPRGIGSNESHLRIHLLPRFAQRQLGDVCSADVQQLKADLLDNEAEPKTINNILSTLGVLLKTAVDWGEIDEVPATIRMLPVKLPEVSFYDFEQYRRLVERAEHDDFRPLCAILLGGDAGLRLGEIIGLEWSCVDLGREQLLIRQSESQGYVTAPKGGRSRYVPTTEKLAAVLHALWLDRDVSQPRVLLRDDGTPVAEQTLRTWIGRAQDAAGIEVTERMHVLRHTFCSHLAMRGAPLHNIKILAGHTSLRTTERYMHLAPSEATRSIQLLDAARQSPSRGTDSHSQKTAVSPTGFEPAVETLSVNSGVCEAGNLVGPADQPVGQQSQTKAPSHAREGSRTGGSHPMEAVAKPTVEAVQQPQPMSVELTDFVARVLQEGEAFLAGLPNGDSIPDGPAQQQLLLKHRIALALLRGEALEMFGAKLAVSLFPHP